MTRAMNWGQRKRSSVCGASDSSQPRPERITLNVPLRFSSRLRLSRPTTDPKDFYDRELAPAWDPLGEAQRAARVEGFADLALMLEEAGDVPGLEPEVIRTKTLILAWAFDETYGYLSRLARGESPSA